MGIFLISRNLLVWLYLGRKKSLVEITSASDVSREKEHKAVRSVNVFS